MTAPQVQEPRQHPTLQPNFHRLLRVKVDSSEPVRVAIDVASALDQLAEHDCWHRLAISAAAWPLASVGLRNGTAGLDRNIDSTGAVGTDSHTPFEGIVEMAVEYLADDQRMLSYLGL